MNRQDENSTSAGLVKGLVKPLVWHKGKALMPYGSYLVVQEDWDDEPFWFVMINGRAYGKCGEHSTEESAKAAAQADYEARILAAIDVEKVEAQAAEIARLRGDWSEMRAALNSEAKP